MKAYLAADIKNLCAKVLEVVSNNDWPTEEGRDVDNGVICTCPLRELIDKIEIGLDNEPWI